MTDELEADMTSPKDLKDAGLKATVPRLRIINLFESSRVRHLSAEDVYKQLPSGMPKGGSSGLQGIDIGNVARMHFDALTSHAQVEHQWKTLEANTKAALVKWAAAPSVNSILSCCIRMSAA